MKELYREYILDLYRHPWNYGQLVTANHSQSGVNPGCGDDITLHLYVQDGLVLDCAFEGQGCALCLASASVVTEHLKGMSVQDVQAIPLQQVYAWLQIPFEPSRVKCVGLALRTAQEMVK